MNIFTSIVSVLFGWGVWSYLIEIFPGYDLVLALLVITTMVVIAMALFGEEFSVSNFKRIFKSKWNGLKSIRKV